MAHLDTRLLDLQWQVTLHMQSGLHGLHLTFITNASGGRGMVNMHLMASVCLYECIFVYSITLLGWICQGHTWYAHTTHQDLDSY